MKKILSLFLISCCLFTIGCSKKIENSQTTKESSTNSVTSSSTNNLNKKNTTSSKLILTNNNITKSKIVHVGDVLIFIDNEENNRVTVLYPDSDKPATTYDYFAESLAVLDMNIYFPNLSDNKSLYRFDYVKKEFHKVINGSFNNLTASNKKLFYIDSNQGNALKSFDSNTNTATLLTEDKCGNYILNGDYILYQNLTDNCNLYSVKIDGTEKTKLTTSPVDSFACYNNLIYYINLNDNKLYVLDINSKATTKFNNIIGHNLKIYNDLLYFVHNNTNYLNYVSLSNLDINTTPNISIKSNINDYWLTDIAVFIEKSININKLYDIKSNQTE